MLAVVTPRVVVDVEAPAVGRMEGVAVGVVAAAVVEVVDECDLQWKPLSFYCPTKNNYRKMSFPWQSFSSVCIACL